mgnify:CR=1 FL=1
MANVDDMLGDDIIFAPSEEKKKEKYVPLSAGKYYGHIEQVTTRDVQFKDNNGRNLKATVYNYKVCLDEENKNVVITYQDREGNPVETDGSAFAGRSYKAKGIFKFHTPKEGDDFESNPGDNKKYFLFCQSLGVNIKKVVRQIDGKDVEVEIMPSLSIDDVTGRPVVAVIDRGKPFKGKDGRDVNPWEVKYVMQWVDGKIKEPTDLGDIPF